MNETPDLSAVRAGALDRIDRAERRYKLAFLAGVGLEALFLAGFLLLADLSNRLHVLLLVSTVATYTIVVVGLVALGAIVNRNTLRIVEAIGAPTAGPS
jgi:hypothetical protein